MFLYRVKVLSHQKFTYSSYANAYTFLHPQRGSFETVKKSFRDKKSLKSFYKTFGKKIFHL